MYDKILTLAVLGALVLTCFGDGKHYDNPDLTIDVHARNGDTTFMYHAQNHLLLTVTPNECYYSVLDKQEQGMLKYEPLEAEARIMKTIQEGKNIAQSTLLTMRSQHEDLLANFHCVGRRVFTLDAKQAMNKSDDSSSESDSSDDDD